MQGAETASESELNFTEQTQDTAGGPQTGKTTLCHYSTAEAQQVKTDPLSSSSANISPLSADQSLHSA